MCAIGIQNIEFSVYVSLASTKLYVLTLKRTTKTMTHFSSSSIHRYLYSPPFIKYIQLVETQIHFLSTVSVKVNDYNIKSVCMWYYCIMLEVKVCVHTTLHLCIRLMGRKNKSVLCTRGGNSQTEAH
jgi:hypothetical protein